MRQTHFEQMNKEKWDSFREATEIYSRPMVLKRTVVVPSDDYIKNYRSICHDLNLAKSRNYSGDLVDDLQKLVKDAHFLIYSGNNRMGEKIGMFFMKDIPRAVRANSRYVFWAHILFYLPFFLLMIGSIILPELAESILGPMGATSVVTSYKELESNYLSGKVRDFEDSLMMFMHYIVNNTSIGFRSMASGALLLFPGVISIIYNGVAIGATFGYLVANGLGGAILMFTSGHSPYELTAIVMAGAVALKLGVALFKTDGYTMAGSLRMKGKEVMPIVIFSMMLFFFAAFVEAFWSAWLLPPRWVKLLVGILGYVFVYWYMFFYKGAASEKELKEMRMREDPKGAIEAEIAAIKTK